MAQRYAKTDVGQEVIKTRSVALSPRQRILLLLCDGKRVHEHLLQDTAGLGVTPQDVADLMQRGLIRVIDDDAPYSPFAQAAPAVQAAPPTAAEAAPAEAVPTEMTAAERYREAYPVATRLTAALGLRGMRLQLEVERCSSAEELRALLPRLLDAAANNPKAKLELQPLRLALGMH
jgi:hypothetical protein